MPASGWREAGGVERGTRWQWEVLVCLIRSCLISTPGKKNRRNLYAGAGIPCQAKLETRVEIHSLQLNEKEIQEMGLWGILLD